MGLRSIARVQQFERVLREKLERYLLETFIRPGCLVFDVGANVGDLVEKYRGLGAKVVAVEPQQENVAKLKERFGSDDNVNVIECALGDMEGTSDLYICNSSDCTSMSAEHIGAVLKSGRLDPEKYVWAETRSVRVTTLDRLIGKYGVPAFCKIDVEGYEDKVLSGLSKAIPALSFEYTPERSGPTLQCISTLSRLGDYEFNYVAGRSMVLAVRDWLSIDEFPGWLQRVPPVDGGPAGDVYARLRKRSL